MNDVNKDKREFIRTKIKRLKSIVKHEGIYKLIEEDETSTPALTNANDISTGGLRIISEIELVKGSFIDLTIPGIETLNRAIVKCEVIRSLFDGTNYYDIGLRFRPPNTGYLKQLIELLKTD